MAWRGMIALVAGLFTIGATANAEVLFSDGFDSGDSWTVQATDDATATFGFDYSAMGIPPAPNGGGTTIGLKMTVNETAEASNEINAIPTGLDVTGQYVLQFDFWANANGPFPGGGGGSTEFIGGGVGLNGGDPGRDGASLIITGEGGSSRDWRLYKNEGEQFVESLQYSDFIQDDANTNNNVNAVLSSTFPGQERPNCRKTTIPSRPALRLMEASPLAGTRCRSRWIRTAWDRVRWKLLEQRPSLWTDLRLGRSTIATAET